MANFDPRRVLRHASPSALCAYFNHKHIDLKIDWTALADDRQPLYEAWQLLPDAVQADVSVDFHEVDTMTAETGIKALLEQGQAAQPPIDLLSLLGREANSTDFVLQVMVQHSQLWTNSVRFALTDQMAGGRAWQRYERLGPFTPEWSNEIRDRLGASLSAYFRKSQCRGRHVHVDHAMRGDGQRVYFIYLSDYPASRDRFDESGHLLRSIDHGVFEIFFACPANGGSVDLCALGGREVRDELLRIFGRCVADVELRPDPNRAPARFELNQLKRKRDLKIDHAEVAKAWISAVTFTLIGGGERKATLHADEAGGTLDIYNTMETWLDDKNVPHANIDLLSVTFRMQLPGTGQRVPSFSFYVKSTGSSNLRVLKEPYRVLASKYLKEWSVDVQKSHRSAAGPVTAA